MDGPMAEIEITEPTDLERGEVNETTLTVDLDTLNEPQIRSHAVALRIDNARKSKYCDELIMTCEKQHRTIDEQSQTLSNRQQLVDNLKVELEEAGQGERDLIATLTEQIEAMQKGNPQAADDSFYVHEMGDALEDYGLNCARIAATDVHNAVAVAFIQLASRIQTEEWTWQDAMNWFQQRRKV